MKAGLILKLRAVLLSGYIPIVVAMSSIQNVVAALKGGPLAIGSGVVGVAVAFALVPVIGKLFGKKEVK